MNNPTGGALKASAAQVNEDALDKAAREGYAIRCKTYGPRTLQKYASNEIMQMQLDNARVIVSAYLAALSVEQAPQPVAVETRVMGGDTERLDGLRELAGYVEDGSDATVSICQDDATKAWMIKAGNGQPRHGRTLREAIDAALASASEGKDA